MYSIEVPKRIEQLISLFSFIGIWRNGKRNDFQERCLKILHFVLCIWLTIALFAGLLVRGTETEIIFTAMVAQACLLHTSKLYYFLWKESQIRRLIHSMGAFSIKDHHEFKRINKKINFFIQFVTILVSLIFCGGVAYLARVLPFLSTKNRLPLNVYSPVNWQNNEMNHWLMFLLTSCQILLCCVYDIFNAFIWYLMLCGGIAYETLGNEFRQSGKVEATLTKTLPTAVKPDLFLEELFTLTQKHQCLQETTEEFRLCFSNIIFIQIVISGFKICGSVYALAFISPENTFTYSLCLLIAVHTFFDIFMVTFLGNEIKFSSDRLSYCFFECNWVEQSPRSIKSLCIIMEVLKRTKVLVIGKLYTLDLQTFSKILNFAYSMFNILKSLK